MPHDNSLNLKDEFPPVTTAEWSEVIRKDLKGAEPSKLMWKTEEGVTVKPFYRAEDLKNLERQLDSAPGAFPYVRGTSATNDWSIRQTIDVADPAQANAAARQALAAGAESIAFEVLPEEGRFAARRGCAERRRHAVAARGSQRRSALFRAHQAAPAILALYLAELKDASAVSGSVDFDPLGDLLLDGASARTPEQIFADAAEVLKFASREARCCARLQFAPASTQRPVGPSSRNLPSRWPPGSSIFPNSANAGSRSMKSARKSSLSLPPAPTTSSR